MLFQPIVERRRRAEGLRWQAVGAEALVRAHSGHGTTLRPDKLLPLVQKAGLMHRLFLFVLAEGLAAVRQWDRCGVSVNLSVNLHVGALLDDAFPRFLSGLLDAADFDPRRLTLELTESSPIADLKHASTNLKALRREGVQFALDDFGAGFSTTTRLAWLECDELKIDKALVYGLEHCEEQRCIVEGLVQLAHSHGMKACAEGVETEAVLQLLGTYGCDRVQGFHVARPMPASEITPFARQWGAEVAACTVADDQLCLPGFCRGTPVPRPVEA